MKIEKTVSNLKFSSLVRTLVLGLIIFIPCQFILAYAFSKPLFDVTEFSNLTYLGCLVVVYIGTRVYQVKFSELEDKTSFENDLELALSKRYKKQDLTANEFEFRLKNKLSRFFDGFLGHYLHVEFKNNKFIITGTRYTIKYLIQQLRYENVKHKIPFDKKI